MSPAPDRAHLVAQPAGPCTVARMETTWGTAIFAEETAATVLERYVTLLEDQVKDKDATARTLAEFTLIADEPVLWLTLAAAQSRLGRLEEPVKARALDIIDAGADLHRWSGVEREQRSAHLSALRAQLTKRQPARRRLRPARGHDTDLREGDLLSVRHKNSRVHVVRVLRVESDARGTFPIVQLTGWAAYHSPSPPQYRTLRGRDPAPVDPDVFQPQLDGTSGPQVIEHVVMAVHTHPSGRPSWESVGFVRQGRMTLTRRERKARATQSTTWAALRHRLDLEVN